MRSGSDTKLLCNATRKAELGFEEFSQRQRDAEGFRAGGVGGSEAQVALVSARLWQAETFQGVCRQVENPILRNAGLGV